MNYLMKCEIITRMPFGYPAAMDQYAPLAPGSSATTFISFATLTCCLIFHDKQSCKSHCSTLTQTEKLHIFLKPW